MTDQLRGAFNSLPTSASAIIAIDDSTDRLAYSANGLLVVIDRSTEAAKAGRQNIGLRGFAGTQHMAFTTDGRWLIAGGDRTLAIFDLLQRSRLATELPVTVAPMICEACGTSMAVDPRGRLAVWTDGADMLCYDVRHARQQRYRNADFALGELAFSWDGATLLSYNFSATENGASGYVGVWPHPRVALRQSAGYAPAVISLLVSCCPLTETALSSRLPGLAA